MSFDFEEYIRNATNAVSGLISLSKKFELVVDLIIDSIENKGKVFFAGNGGSASDAQHLAAEFIGRFQKDRRALAAICLNTDTSVLTALSNDYSFNLVFARQIEALGVAGDIVFLISTSGESANILEAARISKSLGIKTIGLMGKEDCSLANLVDISIAVGNYDTCHIQEAHIAIGQAICGAVEQWAAN